MNIKQIFPRFEKKDIAQKIAIVGGRRVGKSFLFHSMVYRTCTGKQSGALSYFLHRQASYLSSRAAKDEKETKENLSRFIRDYESWKTLAPTEKERWYRLKLAYQHGILGTKKSFLNVDFLDGAGELLQAGLNPMNESLWAAYADASIVVFCLPLWAAFPDEQASAQELENAKNILVHYEQIVQNYMQIKEKNSILASSKCILALTMADDYKRTSLKSIYNRWVSPFIEEHEKIYQGKHPKKTLQTGKGVMHYLENARQISNYMHEKFEDSPERLVGRVLEQLHHFKGKPWIIPVSAVEGDWLLDDEQNEQLTKSDNRQSAPIPVHVELPLLVALCEQTNALM